MPARLRRPLVAALLGLVLVVAWGGTAVVGSAPALPGSAPPADEPAAPGPAEEPDAEESDAELGIVDALVLGVVEGVTEYLPVSSTGHLIVAERLLGVSDGGEADEAIDAYTVIIQFGAILAVLVVSRERITGMLRGLAGRDADGRRLLTALLAAFVPAAVVFLLFGDLIDEYLLDPGPVAAALIAGGIAILVLTRWLRHRSSGAGRALDELTVRSALAIGALQSLALWPGTSRSLVTILGGLLVGLSLAAAVEFSFLLGLVTLSAATFVAAAQDGGTVIDQFGIATPLIGIVAAAVAAFLAVRSFVAFLQRRELTAFGWYRIGFGVLVLILMATTTRI